ncbi:MAG TPA: hypothetical protein VKC60_17960 [Opitutaceae bacterium]|nr:hypothetical protein [Opitutaceae bacterium]
MKPVLKSSLAAVGCGTAVFITFSAPQMLLIWVKYRSLNGPSGAAMPWLPVVIFSLIPAVVGGVLAFFSFWYYFRAAEKRDHAREEAL